MKTSQIIQCVVLAGTLTFIVYVDSCFIHRY